MHFKSTCIKCPLRISGLVMKNDIVDIRKFKVAKIVTDSLPVLAFIYI